MKDISDAQYFTFRRNIPYLGSLIVVHPLFRKAYNFLSPIPGRDLRKANGQSSTFVSPAESEALLQNRTSFDFGFAILFIVAMHGFSAIKIATILYLNYNLATRLPRKYIPAATWIFNIGTLFANELSDGYHFSTVANFFSPVQHGSTVHSWGEWLDEYSGLMHRWEILFNITVLRLISFNLDYYWSLDRSRAGSPIEVRCTCFVF